MDPMPNVAMALPRDIYNVTSYYLNCEGVNTLETDLDFAYEFVEQYDSAITQLQAAVPQCAASQGLSASLVDLQMINGTLNSVYAELYCPPIQAEMSDLLETGLCEQGFEGIYTIWLGQYISVSCLFVVTIIVCVIYQYFGQYWGDIEIDQSTAENPVFEDMQGLEQVPVENPNELYSSTSALRPASTERT
jgi:hypothetical protein